ncbi:MAG: tRNA lysidine(34) synthetase TilS [Eggerthellaceae bacterium]|jgi:tRNA(Ile)-lysidine synthase
MTDLLERVKRTIAERHLVDAEAPVLLMVSGGSDSTALAYLACELRDCGALGPVALLHVNHHLRGKDADDDAIFVQKLAEILGARFFRMDVDVAGKAKETGENLEAIGRRERYTAASDALAHLCLDLSAPLSSGRIMTAHTQDDRVENFYMRSIVGTGPGGFRSMLYRNGPVVRPLLDVSREDLRTYIRKRADADDKNRPVVQDESGELWREDATNAHTDRFRAFVRQEIVPLAKERNPQLLDTLCRSMNLIGDEDDMLDAQAESLMEQVVSWLGRADGEDTPRWEDGCVLQPEFGASPLPMQRRVAFQVLQLILGSDARVETAAVNAITDGFADGVPISGYTGNIQGDLALSANKQGLRIEPMAAYRARRKQG